MSERVLVIEDEVDLRTALRILLERSGLSVIEAGVDDFLMTGLYQFVLCYPSFHSVAFHIRIC